MRKFSLILTCFAALSFGVVGCDKSEHDHDHDHPHGEKKKGSTADDHHHGDGESIGKATVAGIEFEILQEGHVKALKKASFAIDCENKGDAVFRLWFAGTNGEIPDTGAHKAHGHDGDDHLYAHWNAPEKLDGLLLWVEVEVGDKTEKTSFDFEWE